MESSNFLYISLKPEESKDQIAAASEADSVSVRSSAAAGLHKIATYSDLVDLDTALISTPSCPLIETRRRNFPVQPSR